MKKYGFGVDVGGTTVKIGFFETTGKMLDKWEIKTNTENNGVAILPDIAKALEEKLAKEGIDKSDVQGIGIGVPGPVKNASYVERGVNLGWSDVNVAEELGKLTGLNVKVGNDANVAALGEMWQGGAKGSKNVVVVTLGTGVGGGVIIDGKVVEGFNGAGGEIGHINVNKTETKACNCGGKGCLEQYASATGIVRLATEKLAADNDATSLRDLAEVTAKDVFDAAKAGDAVAIGLVDTLGEYLGGALANISCIADPEVFVIGGGVSKAGQILIDAVQKHFKERAFFACRNTRFELATLGNDAGMYGSMQLILE